MKMNLPDILSEKKLDTRVDIVWFLLYKVQEWAKPIMELEVKTSYLALIGNNDFGEVDEGAYRMLIIISWSGDWLHWHVCFMKIHGAAYLWFIYFHLPYFDEKLKFNFPIVWEC